MIMVALNQARNVYMVISILLLAVKWEMISGTSLMPTPSSQFSQSASSFLSSSMVNKTSNHDTVQATVTSLTVHSTSYKTLPTASPTSTTQESDNDEDESKKRQIALICGACAGVVIIVVSITAVICTHSNVQVDQVQHGG